MSGIVKVQYHPDVLTCTDDSLLQSFAKITTGIGGSCTNQRIS